MKRRFRLRQSTDFKRVRQSGKSYAHPLVVLIVLPRSGGETRFGVSAGRSVGNAVQRNRAKRRIRAVLEGLRPRLAPGWDIVVLARKGIHSADYPALSAALEALFRRSGLLSDVAE